MSKRSTRLKHSAKTLSLPADYPGLLADIKQRIQSAQTRAALSVNHELIQLYWEIGRMIVLQQSVKGWGAKVIDRLANDLQSEFPGLTGFSRANIYRMRAFFLAYFGCSSIIAQPVRQLARGDTVSSPAKPTHPVIVPQPVGQMPQNCPPIPISELPWGHNVILIEKLNDPGQRLWYARQTTANGWSRSMLEHWIESDLYARQGQAVTNFKTTLPPPQSDLAEQLIKDPYNFDFLTLNTDARERQLEAALTEQITRFLLELGAGFAFVGRQVHLEIDAQDFYLDLLFYHLELRCFVVVDLKARRFEPEFAGKMNFYLSAVDDRFRKPGDVASIGLILCKTSSKVIAEYALRHVHRPVGVARYVTRLTEKLPQELASKLPTISQIKAGLSTTAPTTHARQRRRKQRT
jgi:predicted nuclease of restriction endonuclease-like (RecB) superfamily